MAEEAARLLDYERPPRVDMSIFFIDTAASSELDRIANLYGIRRMEAAHAETDVELRARLLASFKTAKP